ncbi:MAG: zinc-dependent metalloprotease family protein, partial [Pyrinomonadaceae bacterium]
MKNYRNKSIPAVVALILAFSAIAIASPVRQDVWTQISKTQLGSRGAAGVKIPFAFEAFRLDKRALESLLSIAPEEFTDAPEMILSLPMPDGTFQRFSIFHSLVVDPALVEKYPKLGQTYTGQGIDDPAATVRFDFLNEGFHGMILSTAGTVIIDPYALDDANTYISYFKRDMPRTSDFKCLVGELEADMFLKPLDLDDIGFLQGVPDLEVLSGTQLRTYRVAIAATWEFCDVQPGDNTIANCLAGQVTVLNRVNQVFERDVAIRMVMIPTNGQILFAANNPTCGPGQNQLCTSANDPYTNNNGGAMLAENQATVDARIGNAGYDIGHVFSTGGGGVATLNSPCVTSAKARGVTGQALPFGDPFAIDYVAHEIGHQFGGNHTFNAAGQGSCVGNRAETAAYEPGSGVTIMGYAGICGNQNLAANSIDTFHVKSIEEIVAYSTTGNGNTCAATTATGNTPPTVTDAGNFTIPKLTPFALSATASDPNGDSITYDWQEYDLGPATLAIPNTDNPSAMPIFRPYEPTTSGRRFFPSPFYSLFFANVPPATIGSDLTGELLPQIGGRVMTFQVIARDNRAGGGGVSTASSTLTVASNSGPFQVAAPNTPVSITGGTATTVSWNVNNTTAPPVSEANVRIRLSTDGGSTYTTTLIGSTPNDGSESVTIPNTPSNTARIKIEAVNSVFFDISDTDFIITAGGTPSPTTTPTPSVTPTPTPVTYNASDEFSPTQNGEERVWRYGYSASHTDNAFTAFTETRTDAFCGGQFDAWLVPNNLRIPQISRHSLGLTCVGVPDNALFIHPGQTILGGADPSRRAVVRWTAPESGTFQLTGSLQRQVSSATTDLKIIKNAGASESVIYAESNVSTHQIAYNVTETVQQGDTLDFSVGDGGNGHISDGSSIVINIGPPVTACSIAPANLQVFVPGENSPNDV